MKKLILFVILYSLFVILCAGTKAQWEGAKAQRLTYNTSRNSLAGLYIDKNDKLFLIYHQRWWDPWQQPYRDTLFLMTREKNGGWSEPERIGNPNYEAVSGPGACVPYVSYDSHTSLVHIFYDCTNDTLYYTNSTMPNWETVNTDSGPDRVHPRAIEFDTLRNIHLLWNVDFDSIGGNWYRVMYANNSTGEWVKQQVSLPIWLGGMGSGPAYFDVQKNGAVHIVYHGESYCDWGCQAFYVRNDSLNSTNWITDTLPKPLRPLYYYEPGPIKVDVNDRVHLITRGCIAEDCVWPGLTRNFYYYKEAEDSLWQGPEQIPDTMFGFITYAPQLLIDKQGVPYMGCQATSNEAYFTDREQGSWQVPYWLVGWWHDPPPPDSLSVSDFCFVLDLQGKGHGAFSGFDMTTGWSPDSFEIYYLSSSDSFVDTSEDNKIFGFKLFQNYPNPFNSSTSISYEIMKTGDVTLKIYDILGREVRELVNSLQKPGNYKIIWDGKNNRGKEVASGIYFYRLTVRQAHRPEQSRGTAGNYKQTKKLVLIK